MPDPFNPEADQIEREMFEILGRIVWKCSWIESHLRTIIARQEGLDKATAARALAIKPGRELLRRAAGFIERQTDERAACDASYLRSLDWVFDERNGYVHGIHWVGSQWSRLRVTRTEPHYSEDEITLEEMRCFSEAVDEVSLNLNSMLNFRILKGSFGFDQY